MALDQKPDLKELHNLTTTTFSNVCSLAPALQQVVTSAKVYQKSTYNTSNVAVRFIETLQNVAKAASASEGATKKIGDVLVDVIDTFKEIENMKLEVTKLFMNEVIVPLEARSDVQIANMKATHKGYNIENRTQTELYEKAYSNYQNVTKKIRKKSKDSLKLDAKAKQSAKILDIEESRLKELREDGLKNALIEERRLYCFVTERMCSFGKGIVLYNNIISNFVSRKVNDWSQFILRPTELPAENEAIIQNPTSFKMGTIKGMVSRKDKKVGLHRGKTLPNYYHNKYSTLDGRYSSGVQSKDSLLGVSFFSDPYEASRTPSSVHATSPNALLPNNASRAVGGNEMVDIHEDFSQHELDPIGNTSRFGYGGSNTPTNKVRSKSDSSSRHNTGLIQMGVPNKPNDIMVELAQSLSVKDTRKNPTTKIECSIPVEGEDIQINPRTKMECSIPVEGEDIQINPRTKMENSNPVDGEGSSEDKNVRRESSKDDRDQHRSVGDMSSTDTGSHGGEYLTALFDHVAQDSSQLCFRKDDVINPTSDVTSGWQYGRNKKTEDEGWFPVSYTSDLQGKMEIGKGDMLSGNGCASQKTFPGYFKEPLGDGGTLPLNKKTKNYIGDGLGKRKKSYKSPSLTVSLSMPNVMYVVNESSFNINNSVSKNKNGATDDVYITSRNSSDDLEKDFNSSSSSDSLVPPPLPTGFIDE